MKKLLVFIFLAANYGISQIATVDSYYKISKTQGGFSGVLDNDDIFGNPECIGAVPYTHLTLPTTSKV